MGNARWSTSDWALHANTARHQTREEIFRQRGMHPELDPAKIKFRECVDSAANPHATPIILAADETGSMGVLAEIIIKTGLGTIMKEIYDRKPVPDPQVCCMAVGDAFCDEAPLQVTQFEASIVLAEQVKNFFIEGNGGGNGGESYALAWWFAAYKCFCDSFKKRGRRGYLFTIGDESPHARITREQVIRFLGVGCEQDVPTKELLRVVEKQWHVFHLIVKPVTNQNVHEDWRALLGERAILVPDHEKLAEGIVSIIQLVEGQSESEIVASWDPSTAHVVRESLKPLLLAKS